MSWDIGFTAGLTDEGVDGALVSMGRQIKENTEGVRTFAQGLNSVTRLVTGLAGGFGAVAVYQTLAGLADKMFFAAQREAEERRKGRMEAEATYSATKKSLEIEVIGDKDLSSFAAIQARIDSANKEAQASKGNPLQSYQKGEISLEEYTRLAAELDVELKDIARLGERLVENLDREIAQRKVVAREERERFAIELEIGKLAAQGLDLEAQRASEVDRHAKNLAQIEKFREADFFLAEQQLDLENARHNATLAHIQQEHQARREAEAARIAADLERAEQQQRSADVLESQLEIERYRLDGMKEQADEAERRLKHEQNIQRIVDMKGISEDQRARLLDAERSNFSSRGAGPAANEMAGSARTRSAGQGFINFGALSRLALGGSTNPMVKPVVDEQKKTNTKLDTLINSVKGMAGGATYA